MRDAHDLRGAVSKLPDLYATERDDPDKTKCVKIFGGPATWFFKEFDPKSGTLFGMCDLGMGFPEQGYASIDELEGVEIKHEIIGMGDFSLKLEVDLYWTGSYAEGCSSVTSDHVIHG